MRIDLAIKLLCGALALHTASTQTTIWRRSLVGYSGRFIPGRSLVRIRSPLPLWSNPLGSLAQLVRAPALQAGGHRFESCSFHQLIQIEYTALWSSGLRHRPFTAVTRVRTSVGSPKKRHSNECLFLLPTEVGYFISARYACRTRVTQLTLRYAGKLARSAPTYLSMYLLEQFRDCTAFSQTVGKCFWMNKA